MEKKIKLKTLYLIGVIILGLIGLGIGSTYAMFTTSAEIYNPISLSTTLTSESDIIETFDIEVEAGSNKEIPLTINNTSNSNLNYSVWYKTTASDIEMGTKLSNSDSSPSSSTIASGETKKVYVQIKNNSTSSITVTLGVSSSVSNVVLSRSMTIVPNSELVFSKNLVEYITSLYNDNTKTTVANDGVTYNYATSVNLMNDRLGSSSTDINGGNIRYYGNTADNYIYFNCTDYSNQNADTCELWRIIGVFNGKVKIIRNEPIDTLARDRTQSGTVSYSANWTNSSINTLLNDKYYNGDTVGTVTYNSGPAGSSSKSINMSKIGIKNSTTRGMISESTWRIGYGGTGSADNIYISEENSYSTYSSTWTGKIALPNLSDYMYATDFSTCTAMNAQYGNVAACTTNNWMHSVVTFDTWTLDVTSSNNATKYAYYIPSTGVFSSTTVYYEKAIYPTLVLDIETLISGTSLGTYQKPYKIMPNGVSVKEDNEDDAYLVNHIANLYDNASKSTTNNNSVTYNLASSVGLMNDRKGKLSTPLDDGNIRYYGSSPNNYIYFNCTDYSNQNADTCELWRIIGIFDGKVKIMRNEPIESLARDRTQSGTVSYSANWTRSSINTLLNDKYYNGDTAGTITYNSGPAGSPSKTIDMSKVGLKNSNTRSIISEFTWRIGYGGTGSADNIYISEDKAYTSYSPNWVGKIALPNLSDYMYATDLSTCTAMNAKYGDSAPCTNNNWMHSVITSDTWTLGVTSSTNATKYAYYIPSAGVFSSTTVYYEKAIYPTVYLKTDVMISKKTTGEYRNPYKIIPSGTTIIDNQNVNTLEEYIVNLYDNASKSATNNNSVTYNLASSVGLMNDRKGKLSTPLDEGNIRYYGSNPNNYIYFNCTDYSNQTADTCETWRVVGVFDGKVKIMRNEPIESLARDRTQSGTVSYSANWTRSSINTLLNDKYYNGDTAGTITYNSGPAGSPSKTIDMSKVGLKNSNTRSIISEFTWRIGYGGTGSADNIYISEDKAYTSYSPNWVGKIALPNLSDYMYATDLSTCTATNAQYGSVAACTNSNWMHSIITSDTWTLGVTSSNNATKYAYYIPSTGVFSATTVYYEKAIYPTVYLKSLTKLKSGTTGSSSNPFQIVIE